MIILGLEITKGAKDSLHFGGGYFGNSQKATKIGGIYYSNGKGVATKIYANNTYSKIKLSYQTSNISEPYAFNSKGEFFAKDKVDDSNDDNDIVAKVNPEDGSILWHYTLPRYGFWNSQVDNVSGIASDSQGNVYVSSLNGITKLDKTGEKIMSALSGTSVGTIVCDSKDNVIFFAGSNLYKMDSSLKQNWKVSNHNSSGITNVGPLLDSQDNIYSITEQTIYKYSNDSGSTSGSWKITTDDSVLTAGAINGSTLAAVGWLDGDNDSNTWKICTFDLDSKEAQDLSDKVSVNSIARSVIVDSGGNIIAGGDSDSSPLNFVSIKSDGSINWQQMTSYRIDSIIIGPDGTFVFYAQDSDGDSTYVYQEY